MTMSRRRALTEAAHTAAEEGRWEAVGACYRDRARVLVQEPLEAGEADALLEMDRAVAVRLHLAKTALASLLQDTAAIRHRLHELRLGQGAPDFRSGMTSRRA